jgi:hypothetical protein
VPGLVIGGDRLVREALFDEASEDATADGR